MGVLASTALYSVVYCIDQPTHTQHRLKTAILGNYSYASNMRNAMQAACTSPNCARYAKQARVNSVVKMGHQDR